jgi:hypothetical protein
MTHWFIQQTDYTIECMEKQICLFAVSSTVNSTWEYQISNNGLAFNKVIKELKAATLSRLPLT